MAADSKYTVSKLNGDNYFNWKFKMEMLMKEKGVWKAIKDTAPEPVTSEWTVMDEKALTTIALNVEDDQIPHIRNSVTAKFAWNALKEFHEKDTPSNRVYLFRTIMSQRLEEGGNVEAHVAKMNELYQKLLALSDEIKPEFFMSATLLGSLPSSYDSMILALEARNEDDITLNLVSSKLIAEYKRRIERQQTENDSVALKVNSSVRKDEIVCYFCKNKGHLKRNCPKFIEWVKKKENENEQRANLTESVPETQFMFVTSVSDGWILDSGATCHIASKRDLFTEFNTNHRETVFVANGQKVISAGKGTVCVDFVNKKGHIASIKIENVLYLPSFKGNLISVKRIADKGYTILFNGRICEILADRTQIAIGYIEGNLYKLKETSNKVCAIENSTKNCIHEWHSVLGHRDIEVVKTLATGKLVDGVNFGECTSECKNKLNCEICLQGKMSRIKFPQKSENRAKVLLQLVHSDVCGPMQTQSPSGKRYVLTFIDDFSKFATVYLLKEKSEVLSCFKEFVEICKTMFNCKPKFIRTDNGGEYVNKQLIEYLKQQGIQQQKTAPYTPQQNGVAERKNRTLIEMARCMILESKLEYRFWAEAVSMANFVQNRLPAKNIDKTPFEYWYGTKPSIGQFKRFGSKCYVFTPKERRRKLDAKAIAAVMVGYDLSSKAYRCYVPTTNKVVISRDVKFITKDSEWSIESDEQEITIQSAEDESNDDKTDDEDDNISFADAMENISIEERDDTNDVEITSIRRSERSNKGVPPERLIDEMHANIAVTKLIEPKSYNEAILSNQKEQWISAMNDEMQSLNDNCTYELVKLPENRQAIGCKWVYKIKTDASGEIQQFKARLVAQGFSQKFGIDYDQIFAPVVRQATFRVLLAMATKRSMKIIHLDAKSAFLNGILNETIYMKQPPGYVVDEKEDHVCLLRRSLYGLKQSARVWNQAIHRVLIEEKCVQSQNDPCLYMRNVKGKCCYILIYVDDLLVASEHQELLIECERILSNKFKMKNLGEVRNYLGMQVDKDLLGNFTINQSAYISSIIAEFGLTNAKISNVPIEVSYGKGGNSEVLTNNEKYRQLIGSLLYISVNTRPDISASVSILAQKVSQPNQEDWNEAKRILKYLKGTLKDSLSLGNIKSENTLIGYADANWAESRIDRKSNSGYIFHLYDGTISWSCKRQTCVALSSTEAEFVALSEACKEAIWIRRLLMDFDLTLSEPTTIFEDNQSCLKLIKEERLSGKSKHIDTKFHFVKDYVEKGLVKCVYCPTDEMIADLLTKPLSGQRIGRLRLQCGVGKKEFNQFKEEC